MSESTGPEAGDEPQRAFGETQPGEGTPDTGGDDPGRTAEQSSGPTEGTPEDLKPGAGPGVDPDSGADAGDDARETSP